MRQPRWLQMLSAYWAVICSTIGVSWALFSWGKDLDSTVKAHATEIAQVRVQANADHEDLIEYRTDIKSMKSDIQYIKSRF